MSLLATGALTACGGSKTPAEDSTADQTQTEGTEANTGAEGGTLRIDVYKRQ